MLCLRRVSSFGFRVQGSGRGFGVPLESGFVRSQGQGVRGFGSVACNMGPVTFEGKVLGEVVVLDVLDCYAAFYAPYTEAGLVREYRNLHDPLTH